MLKLPTPCGGADVAAVGGSIGPDGQLTTDDVIAFLSGYFANNIGVADLVGLGGAPADNQLTADDIVAFLAAFFTGCAG